MKEKWTWWHPAVWNSSSGTDEEMVREMMEVLTEGEDTEEEEEDEE